MSPLQEQLVALGAVFEAAVLADRLARTGQITEAGLACMFGSLLARDPESTAEVYGGDDFGLRDGYKALHSALSRDPATLQREPLRYALAMIALERKLDRHGDMLEVIGSRLEQIRLQVGHFGLTHDNVAAAFGGLYQDTISTFSQRIQVHGEMRYLQQAGTASRIRGLLLAGIRSARLWRQLGGRRWQLVFSRGKLLRELQPMLERR